jgi:uncharacterized protein (DUF433 family)
MQTTITETVPIHIDADGVWRVGDTRVTLDTVVAAFKEGATAEEIAQQYSPVSLADIYAVIAYYLRPQAKVEIYLDKRRQEAEQILQENERRFNSIGIRERLLARKENRKL